MQLTIFQVLTSLILILSVKDADSKTFRGFTKSCSDDTPECLRNFTQSVLTTFMGGIPELGIDSLDPFVFVNVQLKLPGGLKVEFVEGQTSGFKQCIVDSVRHLGQEYEVILHCNLNMEGKYISVGKLLMFPLNGEGESTITCKNIKIKINFELISKVVSDGRDHLAIKKFNSTHDFEGRVHYDLTNIIKGNPELSKVVLDFMNNNWRMVAEEFGNPIINYGISTILKSVKKLFQRVPSEELISK